MAFPCRSPKRKRLELAAPKAVAGVVISCAKLINFNQQVLVPNIVREFKLQAKMGGVYYAENVDLQYRVEAIQYACVDCHHSNAVCFYR